MLSSLFNVRMIRKEREEIWRKGVVEKEHEIGIPYASEKGRKGQTNEVGKE